MDATEGLALGLFAILVALLVVVARRMGRLIASTRADDTFRRSVADLVRRADAALAEVTVRLDDVRYRRAAPATIGDEVERAARAMDSLTSEARDLAVGPERIAFRDALVGELGRAGAALGAIGAAIDGVPGTASSTDDEAATRPSAAVTTVKRGYLAVIHARETMADLALRASRVAGSSDGTADRPSVTARGAADDAR